MNAPADAGAVPHRRILVIVIALILYGSLYPWQFHARQYGDSPLWILLHTWPSGGINRYLIWDIAVNVALYVPLGIFGYLSMSGQSSRLARVLAPLALAVTLSAGIEMLQLFDDSRMCSLSDVVSNGAGAALGIAAGAIYRDALRRLLEQEGPASLLRPSGAVLLLTCWLGYQVFPLFPAWGRTNLYHRIAAMGPLASISPADTLVVFAEWIAVACLLESILKRHTTALLAVLWLLVPARLIIAGRSLAWADVAGAAAAYAAWFLLPRTPVRRAAPVLLAGALVVAELAPFRFGSGGAFNWVPFRGFFHSTWQSGFVMLFRKSFRYGSLIWIWRGAGCRLTTATAITAGALLALEGVQVYLPGRTPEITDAVLALLMGLLLRLLRDV
ncbi:MAG TPA: VanZ family protein [Bryobacteraceae bacterium]|nr:VanZ family protein [Bryobacteraceae bacterium]